MDYTEAIVEIKKIIPNEFINKIIPLINKKAKKDMEEAISKRKLS